MNITLSRRSFTLQAGPRKRKYTCFIPEEMIAEMGECLRTNDMVSLRGMIDHIKTHAAKGEFFYY